MNAFDYLLAVKDLGELSSIRGASLNWHEVTDRRPAWNAVSFTAGLHPGSPYFFGYVEGSKSGITGQIGARLATAGMREAAFDVAARSSAQPGELSITIVQAAFKEANRQLYSYGAKMLGAGKIAASGLVLCFDGQRLCVGRTGHFESYLFREGKLVMLHNSTSAGSGMERYLGQNKQVMVDLASVPAIDGDVFVVTTQPYREELCQRLEEFLGRGEALDWCAKLVVSDSAKASVSRDGEDGATLEKNALALVLQVEPPWIDLDQVVE